MDRIEGNLGQGTAAQLAMLKDQCSSLQMIQSGNAKIQEEAEDLRREVQRLRQIRNSLENDLVAKKTKSVQQKIVESLVSKPEDQKNKRALDSREQILDDFERDAKKRKNLTVAGAYRLLSRNVLVVDKDHVGVRFETFFQGSYQDRFYVIFQQEPESGLFSVWRHTLPAFVPLKQLEKEHLNRKFDDFLDIVEEQLQVFVARKEQILEFKREFSMATVRSNAAYNFVHITVPYKNKIFDAYLIYDNLMSQKPTRANVFSQDTKKEEGEQVVKIRAKDREQMFIRYPLMIAFLRSFPGLEGAAKN